MLSWGMPAFIDLTGRRFGRLVALSKARPKNKHTFWRWRCDCGVEKEIAANHVKAGRVISCGCALSEILHSEEHRALLETASRKPRSHGRSRSPEHNIWKAMKQRCLNPKSPDWRYYGGRGIALCERWRSFEHFFEDMGARPEGMTLERRENDGPYSPENCYWATWEEQRSNKRKRSVYAHRT
jgi:hypothetical protein